MATQTERRDATQRAIINAAVETFTAGDLSASLEVIASEAGVTKGSIHYHFGSRAGLLRAVAESMFAKIERRVANAEQADVRVWVRALLTQQATPIGRMLYAINDELVGSEQFAAVDPFPYISLRLAEFEIPAPPPVIAAAIIQYGRQLAFGNPSAADIDEAMADLGRLL